MTKEEALQILDTIPTIGEQVDALEMAISALEQQNKRMSDEDMAKFKQELIDASKEPCDDAISREAVRKKFHTITEWNGDVRRVIYEQDLDELPSVQPLSVLDDIKAEIQEHTQRYTLARESGGMGQVDWSDYLIKADDVIKIINKHTQ